MVSLFIDEERGAGEVTCPRSRVLTWRSQDSHPRACPLLALGRLGLLGSVGWPRAEGTAGKEAAQHDGGSGMEMGLCSLCLWFCTG